jgi:hypothetical protein
MEKTTQLSALSRTIFHRFSFAFILHNFFLLCNGKISIQQFLFNGLKWKTNEDKDEEKGQLLLISLIMGSE